MSAFVLQIYKIIKHELENCNYINTTYNNNITNVMYLNVLTCCCKNIMTCHAVAFTKTLAFHARHANHYVIRKHAPQNESVIASSHKFHCFILCKTKKHNSLKYPGV